MFLNERDVPGPAWGRAAWYRSCNQLQGPPAQMHTCFMCEQGVVTSHREGKHFDLVLET